MLITAAIFSVWEACSTQCVLADLLNKQLADLQHPARSPSPAATGGLSESPPKIGPCANTFQSRTRPARRAWLVAGFVLLAVLTGLGITEATGVTHLAATVIRIVKGECTLAITVDDPAVSVAIEGEDIVITEVGTSEVRLKPGSYRLRAEKDGKPVAIEQELVSITRGGREVVNVKLLPPEEPDPLAQKEETPWSTILPENAPPPAVAPFDAATAKRHQQAWAEYLGVPVEREIDLPENEKLTLILIPPGEFLMGSFGRRTGTLPEKGACC